MFIAIRGGISSADIPPLLWKESEFLSDYNTRNRCLEKVKQERNLLL